MPVSILAPFTTKTPKRMVNAFLVTGSSILFTVPVNTKYSDIRVILNNSSTSDVTVTLSIPGTVLSSKNIPARETLVVPFDITMDANENITAYASASSSVRCLIMGNEVT
ncbi:hypothetical protein ACFLFF_26995 [Brevibacillus reuszeri]|uniref:hypothetical protein n=1 Tax=Brevibacillus reuszeri TaxID=54915 RepID=UPI00366E64EA